MFPRISIRIPPCQPVPDMVGHIQRAERAGFHAVGIPDSPMLWRDTFAVLVSAAMGTERVGLRTLVTNPVTRHPWILASSIRTVAELAHGRFQLGLGAGDSAVFLTGGRPARHAEMRSAITMIRDLLDGKPASPDQPNALLHDPTPVEILLAADGPRNLRLAADLADGVITTSRHLDDKRSTLDAAVADSDRTHPLRHIMTVEARVTDDVERDACAKKRTVFKYLQREGTAVAEEAGFPVRVPGRKALSDGADASHARDTESAEVLAREYISDELALWYWTNFAMWGSVDDIVDQLAAYAAQGIDEISLKHGASFDIPVEMIDLWGQEIIPRLQTRPGA